jgi:hypothetical protein
MIRSLTRPAQAVSVVRTVPIVDWRNRAAAGPPCPQTRTVRIAAALVALLNSCYERVIFTPGGGTWINTGQGLHSLVGSPLDD